MGLLPAGAIPEQVVGRIENFCQDDTRPDNKNSYLATISYADETAAGEFTQFLNVVFGNISMKFGIQVADVLPSEAIGKLLPGPQFGIQGIRQQLNIPKRPLLFTALKPMGLSAADLADLAGQFVHAGIDIVKDDHGLSDQVFSPFEERVQRCAAAVAEANAKLNRNAIYVPNITAPTDKIPDKVQRAKELGAGGVMISPGLTGLDTLRFLGESKIGLPIIAHPAFIGSYIMNREQGIACGVLFGTLMRLAGADATIFPNYGGRFPLTLDDCLDIVNASRCELNGVKSIFPCPAGGMELKNIPDMLKHYGNDMLILVGSGLFRLGGNLIENGKRFQELLADF
jgi:ribulose-bisphosphate carboxylase large chain